MESSSMMLQPVGRPEAISPPTLCFRKPAVSLTIPYIDDVPGRGPASTYQPEDGSYETIKKFAVIGLDSIIRSPLPSPSNLRHTKMCRVCGQRVWRRIERDRALGRVPAYEDRQWRANDCHRWRRDHSGSRALVREYENVQRNGVIAQLYLPRRLTVSCSSYGRRHQWFILVGPHRPATSLEYSLSARE
ncbi:hypothetical protein B0H16DRAFT_350385 [Mycena metata]|uniref:Uncharacterized protein n=1 Tax=Mycena metata TaxID=1033252 RepID=A0AAD7HK14_9AGAR|nr:hypothetical protein B0H16DRAFT_350385 [Mycena metata]